MKKASKVIRCNKGDCWRVSGDSVGPPKEAEPLGTGSRPPLAEGWLEY